MSDTKCDRCGARFGVPGAVGTLDQHMANFHPDAASPAQLQRAEKQGDTGERPATSAEGGLTTLPSATTTETPTETTPSEKALDKMTTAELEAVAAAEEIDLSAASTNKERAAAIEKARAAKS